MNVNIFDASHMSSDPQQSSGNSLGNLLTSELELARVRAEASGLAIPKKQNCMKSDSAGLLVRANMAALQHSVHETSEDSSHRLRRLLQKRLCTQQLRDSQKQKIKSLEQQLELQAAQLQELQKQLADSEAQTAFLRSLVYAIQAGGTSTSPPQQLVERSTAPVNAGSAGSPCSSRFLEGTRPASAGSHAADAHTDSPTPLQGFAPHEGQWMQSFPGNAPRESSSTAAAAATRSGAPCRKQQQHAPATTAAGQAAYSCLGLTPAAGIADRAAAADGADAVLQVLLTSQKDQLKKALMKALAQQQQQKQTANILTLSPQTTTYMQQDQLFAQVPRADSMAAAAATRTTLQQVQKRQKLVPQHHHHHQQQQDIAHFMSKSAAYGAALQLATSASFDTPPMSVLVAGECSASASGIGGLSMQRCHLTPPAGTTALADLTANQPVVGMPPGTVSFAHHMLLPPAAPAGCAWGKAPAPICTRQQQPQQLESAPMQLGDDGQLTYVAQQPDMTRASTAPAGLEHDGHAALQQQHSAASATEMLPPASAPQPTAAAAAQQQASARYSLEGASSICSTSELPCGTATKLDGLGDVPALEFLDQLPGDNSSRLLDVWMCPCPDW